jgi:hypothetical protein
MKTTRLKRSLHPLGLIATLIVMAAAIAAAQTLEIPAPSSQGPPPMRYRPRSSPQPMPPSSGVETIPPAPQVQPQPAPTPPEAYRSAPREAPISPPSHQIEPVLPAIFRGCWQGRVSELDSIQRIPGGAKLGTWTPKTYRLCYQRVGGAPFDLTFTEAGISRDRRITNATGRMQPLTTDGRTYASMRAFLHFDEYHMHQRYFGGGTFSVDEITNLQCDIESDGMHVWGQVLGHRDGTPWFRAWWHSVFVHVPDGGGPAAGIPE